LIGPNEREAPNKAYLDFRYAIQGFRASLSIDSLGIVRISTGEIFLVPTVGGLLVRPLDFKPPITITIIALLMSQGFSSFS
jgi:hypothetical protein